MSAPSSVATNVTKPTNNREGSETSPILATLGPQHGTSTARFPSTLPPAKDVVRGNSHDGARVATAVMPGAVRVAGMNNQGSARQAYFSNEGNDENSVYTIAIQTGDHRRPNRNNSHHQVVAEVVQEDQLLREVDENQLVRELLSRRTANDANEMQLVHDVLSGNVITVIPETVDSNKEEDTNEDEQGDSKTPKGLPISCNRRTACCAIVFVVSLIVIIVVTAVVVSQRPTPNQSSTSSSSSSSVTSSSCRCDTPNNGTTAGYNNFTCSDGTASSCASNEACIATETWSKENVGAACQVTCACNTPNAGTGAGYNNFTCSDGTSSSCETNEVCSAMSAWTKGNLGAACQVPFCRCDTPNTGTAEHNRFTCSDGTGSYCASYEACTATEPWAKGDFGVACQVTCACDTPNTGTEAGLNNFTCSDGTSSSCGLNKACTVTETWTRRDVETVCK